MSTDKKWCEDCELITRVVYCARVHGDSAVIEGISLRLSSIDMQLVPNTREF